MRGYADRDDRHQSSFPKRLTEKGHRGRVESFTIPEPDVFDLVPTTADTRHLERCWRLDEWSTPLLKLVLWQPVAEDDQQLRAVLLEWGRQVMLSRPLKCPCCGRIHALPIEEILR